MKWQGRRQSRNIEDRRGAGRGTVQIGGAGLLIILALGYFLGVDVTPLLENQGQIATPEGGGEITEADRHVAQLWTITILY